MKVGGFDFAQRPSVVFLFGSYKVSKSVKLLGSGVLSGVGLSFEKNFGPRRPKKVYSQGARPRSEECPNPGVYLPHQHIVLDVFFFAGDIAAGIFTFPLSAVCRRSGCWQWEVSSPSVSSSLSSSSSRTFFSFSVSFAWRSLRGVWHFHAVYFGPKQWFVCFFDTSGPAIQTACKKPFQQN